MQGGGIKGLMNDEEDDNKDDEIDPEEQKMVEEQFNDIWTTDAELRKVLGEDKSSLGIKEKYQILVAYKKGGGVQGLLAGDEEEEESIIMH